MVSNFSSVVIACTSSELISFVFPDESIMMVAENEVLQARTLFSQEMKPICSCLDLNHSGEASTMMLRAVLESIVNHSTRVVVDVAEYINCTLFAASQVRIKINLKCRLNETPEL